MGRVDYAGADSLFITADAGGSNGWGLITACHFPLDTRKWTKIEHRLFSHIAMNGRGTPLTALAIIVSLIGVTTSTSGLRVRSEIDCHA